MSSLRVAIIGCGRMGTQHARVAARLGHRVAVVCDTDPARASLLAQTHPHCTAVADPGEIRWSALDAGFVCTPPFARGLAELMAAQAGVPLFLEKPIGLSASQCLPALRLIRASGTITSVGYMNRYRGSVQRVRDFLETEPALGFVGHWVGPAYRVSWWADPALSGGQLNEQCTHLIDLARYLVGEITEVGAFAQRSPEDEARNAAVSVLLRFQNGALGTVLCGCSAREKQIGCRIFTPRGQLTLEGWDFRLAPIVQLGDLPGAAGEEDVFFAETSAFLAAVQSGDARAIRCDLADAMRTQRVVDAARAALIGGDRRAIGPERTMEEASHAFGPT